MKPRGATFNCPACGELLKYDYKHTLDLWIISVGVAIVFTRYLGLRGLALVPVVICVTLIMLALGFFLAGIIDPPGFKRVQFTNSKPNDINPFNATLSLHLGDKESKKDSADESKKTDT